MLKAFKVKINSFMSRSISLIATKLDKVIAQHALELASKWQ